MNCCLNSIRRATDLGDGAGDVVVGIGIVLYLAAARRGPAMRSLFAAGTLAVSLVMTLLC